MTGTDLPDFSRKEKRLLRRLPAGKAVSDFFFIGTAQKAYYSPEGQSLFLCFFYNFTDP